jgi:hypothetical protein
MYMRAQHSVSHLHPTQEDVSRSDRRALVIVALLGVLSVPSTAASKVPCDKIDRVPGSTRLVQQGDLIIPQNNRLSEAWTTTVPGVEKVVVELNAIGSAVSLYGVMTRAKSGLLPICTNHGVLRDSAHIYEFMGLTSGLNLSVSSGPGAKIKILVYTSGLPAASSEKPADPLHVGLPLHVFVTPNAPLSDAVNAHVKEAVAIWTRAGVHLQALVVRLSAEQTKSMLGDSLSIDGYLGCGQRFDGDFARREALWRRKPNPSALGVFFVRSASGSQAEPEFLQAYISSNPFNAPVGRTLAHEIGHLLLGDGHTGGQQRIKPCDRAAAEEAVHVKRHAPWTSGLMRDGGTSTSTDISGADATTARRRAIELHGAVWWQQ